MASYTYGPWADAGYNNVYYFGGPTDGAQCLFSTDGYGTALNMSTYIALTDQFSYLRMDTSVWPRGVADAPLGSYFARVYYGVSVSNAVVGTLYLRVLQYTPTLISYPILTIPIGAGYVADSPYVATSGVFTVNVLGGPMPTLTSNVLTNSGANGGPWQLQLDTVNGITGGSIYVYAVYLGITTAAWPTVNPTTTALHPTESLSLQPYIIQTDTVHPTETLTTAEAVVVTESLHATESFDRTVLFRGAHTSGGHAPTRPGVPRVERT